MRTNIWKYLSLDSWVHNAFVEVLINIFSNFNFKIADRDQFIRKRREKSKKMACNDPTMYLNACTFWERSLLILKSWIFMLLPLYKRKDLKKKFKSINHIQYIVMTNWFNKKNSKTQQTSRKANEQKSTIKAPTNSFSMKILTVPSLKKSSITPQQHKNHFKNLTFN